MKAPSIALKFANETFDCLGDDSGTEVWGRDNNEPGVGSRRRSGRKGANTNYQIPKSSRLRAKTNSTGADTSQEDEVTCLFRHDDSSINPSTETLVVESSLLGLDDFQKEIQGQPHPRSRSVSPVRNTSSPPQQKVPCGGYDPDLGLVDREPPVVLKEVTGRSEDSAGTLRLEEAEKEEQIALPNSKESTSSDRPTLTASSHEEPTTPASISSALGRQSRLETPLSDDETNTSNTTLEMGSLLSPLTQYDQTASLSGKDSTGCPETPLLRPSKMTQQQLSQGSNDATQVQNSGEKQLILAQENQTIAPLAPLTESPSFDDMVANSVQIVYEMSKCQEKDRAPPHWTL
ncbi:hypothetical protein B0O99DRAFT_159912 [Bisporella sp. PMI_857]|nr:hypothetical protein B0O99DRAFT_159912 [Bisporella sp. PMI_857]